jgi:hypothetical protein
MSLPPFASHPLPFTNHYPIPDILKQHHPQRAELLDIIFNLVAN